jgi:hypothetical protein
MAKIVIELPSDTTILETIEMLRDILIQHRESVKTIEINDASGSIMFE